MTDSNLRYLYRQQPETGLWIEEHGPFDKSEAERLASLALDTGIVYAVGLCTSEDGRTVIKEPCVF